MSELEQDFIDEGAQLVWVLQDNLSFQAATSQDAEDYYNDRAGSLLGVRVGDGETAPEPGTFKRSPFITTARGFAMIVRKADMRILFADTHGNERNLDGPKLLDELRLLQGEL